MGVSKKLLTPSVIEAVVKTVNEKRITNSKDFHKLRSILPDPVARLNFFSDVGDLETAMRRMGRMQKSKAGGIEEDLDVAVEAMKNVPLTAS